MAAAANRDQISPSFSMLVSVIPTECKMGESFDMTDVMHQICGISPAADLAIPTIIPKDCSSKLPPLRADVERVDVTCGD